MKKAYKCTSAAQGAEIIKYLESLGGNNECCLNGEAIGYYYYIKCDSIIGLSNFLVGYTEAFLPKENKYPKVMLVKDIECDYWRKRVVFMEKNGKYISWNDATSIEEAEDKCETSSWYLAKDIEEETPTELTLEQIEEKFNVKVENLKIVK